MRRTRSSSELPLRKDFIPRPHVLNVMSLGLTPKARAHADS